MNRFSHLFCTLFCFVVGSVASAQSPSILLADPYPVAYCREGKVPIHFTTGGVFPEGNAFKVQISVGFNSTSGGTNFGGYSDLPGTAVFTTSPALVQMPTYLPDYYFFQLRIVATKVAVSSQETNPFRLTKPVDAELYGGRTGGTNYINWLNTDYVNPFTPVELTVSSNGTNSYTATLSDSSRYEQSYYPFLQPIVNPATTSSYTLVNAYNSCGTGTAKGNTTINVNKIGFLLTDLSLRQVCQGGRLLIYFSTAEPLPDDTQFTAEFSGYSAAGKLVSVTAPVPGNKNPLVVIIPPYLPPGPAYVVRIASANTGIEAVCAAVDSYVGNTVTISVSEPPVARLFGATTISRGESASLTIETINASPVMLQLSDGNRVTLPTSAKATMHKVAVSPTQTTTYSLVGGSSVCGTGSFSGTSQVTVMPSIRVDSLSAYRVCTGDTLYAYLSSDLTALPADPVVYTVLLSSSISSAGTLIRPAVGQVIQIRGKVATIVIPRMIEGGFYYLQPQVANQAINGSIYGRQLNIGSPPRVLLGNYKWSVNSPQITNLTFTTTTGLREGTFLLSDSTSVSFGADNYPGTLNTGTFVKSTTAYKILSASNLCGTGTVSGTTVVTVSNPNSFSISLKNPSQTYYCANSLLTISLSGSMAPGENYTVEISDRVGNFPGTILPNQQGSGTLTIRLPTQVGSYKLRVSAGKLGLISNELAFYTSSEEVTAAIRFGSDYNSTYYDTQRGFFTVASNILSTYVVSTGRPPYSFTLSDGRQIVTNEAGYLINQAIATSPKPFSVVSISDACRMGIIKPTPSVSFIPFLLQTDIDRIVRRACIGAPLLVPFTVLGQVPEGITFSVQVSEDARTYRDLATVGSASPLQATLSEDMVGQAYFVRVVAKSGTTILNTGLPYYLDYSHRTQIIAPLAALVLPSNSLTAVRVSAGNVWFRPGQSSVLTNFSAIQANGSLLPLDGTTALTIKPVAGQPTMYSLLAASNSCGYSPVTGVVPIDYETGFQYVRVLSAKLCTGRSWRVEYKAVGKFDAGNKFIFSLRDVQYQGTYLLYSTTALQGTLNLPITADLPAGSYSFKVESSNPPSSIGRYDYVQIQHETGVITGSKTIMEGDSARLTLALTGTPPWAVMVGTPTDSQQFTVSQSPSELTVKPNKTTTYQLLNVYNNECGTGIVSGTALITVTRILATDPAWAVSVFPNPAQNVLHVVGPLPRPQRITLTLHDLQGRRWHEWRSEKHLAELSQNLDLQDYPVGVYLLTVSTDEQRLVFRVLKR